MKKLIIVLLLGLLFSCTKEETFQPQNSLVHVELYAYSLSGSQIDLNIQIFGEGTLIIDSISVIPKINTGYVFYSKEFYITDNKEFTVNIDKYQFNGTGIFIQAYINPGKKCFKILEENQIVFNVQDNCNLILKKNL